MVDAHPSPYRHANGPSTHPAPHLPPQPHHLSQPFTWQYIWNLFMSAPRTRSWLFQNQTPDTSQVVRSLLNTPVLLGFVFGAHISPQPYAFPDVGDLHAVYSHDADTTLGFHFGFQGVNPIIPVLFQVSKDPFLSNPNVVVRRTAKRILRHANCILAIEFSWLVSGALAVCTNVHPLHNPDSPQAHPTAFFEQAEMRVFKRATVERFVTAVQLLDHTLPQALLTPQVNGCIADFFHPPDHYYSVIINEISDTTFPLAPSSCDSASTFSYSAPQTFYAQNQILTSPNRCTANNNVCTDTTQPLDATCHPHRAASAQQFQLLKLWNSYQHQISAARTTGIFKSMISRKAGGRFANCERLFGRQAHYTFLCTTGINLKGRIHRLCRQIGIDISSPRTDGSLMDPSGLLAVRKRHLECAVAVRDDFERVLDAAQSLSDSQFDWKRRKLFDSRDTVLGAVTDRSHAVHTAVDDGFRTPPLTPLVPVESPSTGYAFSSVSTGVDAESSVEGVANGERAGSGNGSATAKRQRTSDSHLLMEDQSALSPSATPWLGHDAFKPDIDTLVRQARERTLNVYSGQAPKEENSVDGIVDLGEVLSDGDVDVDDGKEGNVSTGVNANSRNELNVIIDGQVNNGGSKQVQKGCKSGKAPSTTIWMCDRCGVSIRGKKGNLNRHIANKHDNIRAYACKFATCGKRFQTRLNLVRHEKAVHQGRPFACQSCPRTFKVEKDLRAHVSTAHGSTDTELACEVCGSCFGRRSTLNRHLSKVHKIATRNHQSAGF